MLARTTASDPRAGRSSRDKRASWALMLMARSRSRVLPGASPSLRKATIPHCSTPRSCTLTPGRFASSPRSSAPSDLTRASIASIPNPRRVTGGDAQADLAGDESLPVFEPARVVTDDVSVGLDPGGGVKIYEGRLEPLDGVAPHVEEARAAGPAQILAARGREHVTADLRHID